jgi:hypothetical protein
MLLFLSIGQEIPKAPRSFSRVSRFFSSIFDSPLKFPSIDLRKNEDCIWTRQMGSRLYRLNSTFYNGTKGINRNAIRYDSKFMLHAGSH